MGLAKAIQCNSVDAALSENYNNDDETIERIAKKKRKAENTLCNLSGVAYTEKTPLIVTLPDSLIADYSSLVDYALKIRKERGVTEPSESIFDFLLNAPRQERQKTALELLAEKRDYKRRRQTYRAKNTHITKRTPTQVARDTIFMRLDELNNAKAIKLAKDDPFFMLKIKKEEQQKQSLGLS